VSAQLGGPGTTTGPGLQYQWLLDGQPAGNGGLLTVQESGQYELIVTNASGCSDTDNVSVDLDADLPSATGLSAQNVRCHGETNGAVRVEAIASAHPPVLVSLNGGPFGGQTVFEGLGPGFYTVTLQDALGCTWTSDTLEVEDADLLTAELGPDLTVLLGDTAFVELQTSFTAALLDTIIWDPLLDSAGINMPFQHFSSAESHLLAVRVLDANGCEAGDRIRVYIDNTRRVYVPNIFSPSGSANAVFTVYGGKDVEEVEVLHVYDRWGESIFTAEEFLPNDESVGWNGNYRGKQVSPGVYVYYTIIRFKDGKREIFSGDVTVYR
jgi:gliding motility-associated-like protein